MQPRRAAVCAGTALDADRCCAHRTDAAVRCSAALLRHPWCRLCQHCCPAGTFPRGAADRASVPLSAYGLCHDGGAKHPYRGTVQNDPPARYRAADHLQCISCPAPRTDGAGRNDGLRRAGHLRRGSGVSAVPANAAAAKRSGSCRPGDHLPPGLFLPCAGEHHGCLRGRAGRWQSPH